MPGEREGEDMLMPESGFLHGDHGLPDAFFFCRVIIVALSVAEEPEGSLT